MTIFNLIINSKNKIFINYFLSIFNKYLYYNPVFLTKYIQKKVGIKIITLLRSPHVNKKSQEKFKNKIYNYFLKLKVQKSLKFLFFLKILGHKVFSNINLKIKQLLSNQSLLKDNFNIVNLNNFNIGMLVYKIAKIKNFKLKIELNFLKKNSLICCTVSKKTNQLFSTLQLYCEFFKLT
jgi:Ribosomal protein S10p/S20e